MLASYQSKFIDNQEQGTLETQQAFSTMLKAKNEVEERLHAVQQYYQFRAKSASNKNDNSLKKYSSLALKRSLSKHLSTRI